jgi:hypothetical protein
MSRTATLPYGTDQIIDAAMARALHADACRNPTAVAWIVLWNLAARKAAKCEVDHRRPAVF